MVARNRTRARTYLLTTAVSMALLTGCGGGGDDDPKAAGGTPTGAAKPAEKGPAYQGAALPGYGARAAWSLDTDGTAPGVLDLGGVLLFARDASGAYLTDASVDGEPADVNTVLYASDEPEKLTLEFRDARTGAVRGTLAVTAESVEGVTWKDGVPAVAVGTSATKESDGLTQEETTTSATFYSTAGAKLGETSGYAFGHVVGGYVVSAEDGVVRLAPIGAGAVRTVPCNGDDDAECDFDPETGVASGDQTYAPVVADGYYPGFEAAGKYDYDPSDVTLNDLATGKRVWSSADAEVPKGVALDDEGRPEDRTIRIVRVSDGKALVAWKKSVGLSPTTQVYAWYDLASGALTASYEGPEYVVWSADGELAAEDKGEFETGFEGTSVWKTADGTRLWAQEDGETALDPVRFSGNGEVLYGETFDGVSTHKTLAVDTQTRKVLAKDLPEGSIPAVDAASGYGYLATEDGFFAFAPA